ncbi:MAG: hypothetical protein HQM14_05550 [SAR324 cluster bacterium]|nr:hypothetical protein [SAR324 cluster bacterium]
MKILRNFRMLLFLPSLTTPFFPMDGFSAMNDIYFFSNNNKILTKIKSWVDDLGTVLQIKADSALLKREALLAADIFFIDFDEISKNFFQDFFNFYDSLPKPVPLLLLSQNFSQLPPELWENSCIDFIEKPLQKELIRKRVQHALHQTTILRKSWQQEQLLAESVRNLHAVKEENRAIQEEMKHLLQEIHHRVKNNLQIVSSILTLNSTNAENPQLEEILRNTQSRVDTISLVHKKLYESSNLTEVEMEGYVQQQMTNLFNHFPLRSNHISLDLQSKSVWLNVDRAIHCALLVNELVINVFRHAFPEEQAGQQLRVLIGPVGKKQAELVIADNGIGLPEHIDPSRVETTGLLLVYHLVQQLGGTMEIKRNAGTSFQIQFARG